MMTAAIHQGRRNNSINRGRGRGDRPTSKSVRYFIASEVTSKFLFFMPASAKETFSLSLVIFHYCNGVTSVVSVYLSLFLLSFAISIVHQEKIGNYYL
ncbi:hypothetical protein CDAR_47471 [Caerostris darwini]|uniref:Uncharacterized protein n=1 Tax=Caerostris darwini TaxID=1538125 RepID=A0AAV4M993_9ARAC|nr:hypothetical protein CDAR_47471 [Caerostris darwini]